MYVCKHISLHLLISKECHFIEGSRNPVHRDLHAYTFLITLPPMKTLMPKNPLVRMLVKIARMLLLVYIGFMLLLAFRQRSFVYYPERAPLDDLTTFARNQGLTSWHNAKEEYIGWRPAESIPEGADLFIVFHGNAGFALHRTYIIDGLQRPLNEPAFYVFLFEYPGYGPRAGRPSEEALTTAAAAAFEQLRKSYPGSRIFLAGESLGSGVAAWLAGEYPTKVSGLFLLTAFNRLADVAQHHYPIMPVNLLLRERYESSRALENYRGPIAILLAGNDNVVPPQFGKKLYEAYQGPKRLWVQDNRNHNTLDYGTNQPWWQEVKAFLMQHAPPKPVLL